MPVDIKKMQRKTGIPESLLEKYLGVRIHLTNYTLALSAYKNAVKVNGISTISRKIYAEELFNFCDTFYKAFRAFKVAPENSSEKELFFILMTKLVENQKDAARLCKVIPLKHPLEKAAVLTSAKYFVGPPNPKESPSFTTVQKMNKLCLEKQDIPYKSLFEIVAEISKQESK